MQKNQAMSHDLVTEVYLFLLALEPELDETNVDQAHQAVETLTELCQGNLSQGNSNLLLQTKLVSILERLIERSSLGGGGGAAAETEMLRLRLSSLTLLQALLEGSSSDAMNRMLRVIDLQSLARATGKTYEDALALPKKSPSKQLLTDASYSLYLLLRLLRAFQEKRENILPGQILTIPSLAEKTKKALDQTVTSVEIVNAAGELERIFFRHPAFCLLLTEATRERLLWAVDRETPGKQVQEFLIVHTPEVRKELQHLERIERWPVWKV